MSGFQRGIIRKLQVEEAVPPRAVGMFTLQDTEPPAAARRFMEFVQSGSAD